MVNGKLLDLTIYYRNILWPRLSHLRGATKVYKLLEELTLRRLAKKNGGHYRFEFKGYDFKITDYNDLKSLIAEPNMVEKFIESIDNDSIICDVGAYHGFYSILGSIGEKVYSFEMSENNVPILKDNLKLNSIQSSNLINKPVWSDLKSLEVEMENSTKNMVGGGHKVKSITLDRFFQDKLKPDVVKIDVEGAEYQVLKGMEEILGAEKPSIFIELHSEEMIERQGGTREKVLQLLKENGYEEIFSQERGSETLKIFQ